MRDRLIDWSASVRAQRLFVSEFVLLELVAVGAEKGSAGEVEDGESDREGCAVAYDSGESFDFFSPPSSAIAHTYQQKEAKVGEGGERERERENTASPHNSPSNQPSKRRIPRILHAPQVRRSDTHKHVPAPHRRAQPNHAAGPRDHAQRPDVLLCQGVLDAGDEGAGAGAD